MTDAIDTIELYNKIYDKNIQELDLSNRLSSNRITDMCPKIGRLRNLQILNLSFNKINNICPEIGRLQNLRILDLSCNRINNMCSEIGQLQNLQELNLGWNEINNICPEIGQLQNLQRLSLSDNQITQICPEIGQLLNLRKLDLGFNQINNICSEIGQLQNLQILYLSGNRITNVCPEIGLLLDLRKLYLNDNRITIIPANIIQCNNLTFFRYHDNDIEHVIPCVWRFLDRIRNAGGTIINIYNDRQNVHTSSIQTSIKNSIFNLLNTHYETNDYIDDVILTTKTKQLITEYISLDETHSNLDCTFEEIFKAVWNEILTFEINIQNEIKKRLNEEMDDAECKCFTGRISHLVNCLSGYSDKVLIQISDTEQIGNIISLVKSKHNGSSVDIIRQIVKDELTERKFDSDIIEEWISFIN